MVAPEIRNDIADSHHRSLAACVYVRTCGRIVEHVEAECILKVHRRTTPFAPAVAIFVHTRHAEVRLEGVLRGPLRADHPAPCNHVLRRVVAFQGETVSIVFLQRASAVVHHVLCQLGGFLQVSLVELSAHAGLCQINLGQQTLGAVFVETSFGALLGQQFDGLLQSHDDIFVDIGFLHFWLVVIGAGCNHAGVVVYDGYIAKRANQVEVGHSFPQQTFAHGLVLHSLRGSTFLNIVAHHIGVAVDSPQRVGHVADMLVVGCQSEAQESRIVATV